MSASLLLENLTNPALLFFLLGIFAVQIKSDLAIPETSSKFISLYLLFAIGFEGGQEMAHSPSGSEFLRAALLGIGLAMTVPLYVFFLARAKFGSENAGAIAAAYGSISAVTFVTAVSLLESQGTAFHGHLVAVMALMEAPAIVVGVFLKERFGTGTSNLSWKEVIRHALGNGSVVLILGSLVIGATATEAQAEGIHPFTTDLFKGFLAIFLLDMGLVSGRGLRNFMKNGAFAPALAIVVPLVNGAITAYITGWWFASPGDRFLFSVLAASASYIAVPAAMRLAAPEAQPGLYIPMALAVTFPVNLTLGFPIYQAIIG
jgi:hypothetical protein